jgi:hypothetical protein
MCATYETEMGLFMLIDRRHFLAEESAWLLVLVGIGLIVCREAARIGCVNCRWEVEIFNFSAYGTL